MQIGECYSHLNGKEYLLVHRKKLWKEVQKVIAGIDAEACKTKVSKEKTMPGRLLYSPEDMNKAFKRGLDTSGLARSGEALSGLPPMKNFYEAFTACRRRSRN